MEFLPDMDERYLRFFELFNERDFYECHEVLEELWMETRAEERSYYQGLIQTATAFYHLANGNLQGARKLFTTGIRYLESFPDHYMGFGLEAYRATCRAWLERTLRRIEGDRSPETDLSPEGFPVLVPPVAELDAPPTGA